MIKDDTHCRLLIPHPHSSVQDFFFSSTFGLEKTILKSKATVTPVSPAPRQSWQSAH